LHCSSPVKKKSTMGALRRNRRTPSRFLIVLFIVLIALCFFDSCRLLRFKFPDCSLQYYEFFTPKPASQSKLLTTTFTSGNWLTGPSLASQQSYGFFNDIPDDSWSLMQRRARTSLGQAPLPDILPSSNHENPNIVSSYLNNLQVSVL
jgi:hypothetical protein